ncbi:cytochrome c maturation protein CcmE [Mangrovibrevibacter kandeliae]|uniref:cytochrome c maturation protein CcmE n=1 Tax=Mangrovibrevibacter kandeliae TaxID=2968473 RepID=UPI0021196F34|nr:MULTISPECIES: cytochrome c maturation protein CcmE [unclassified Aurantimonas]MCQ8781096.1 cytochrome c maturation protein CcmE [Aurantimonas sp. CSK15Z-1]MCW4113877.1 cytochrome c maturation protein CcmE [Aurantimonas sp. MSK8Z-1]
MTRKQKRLSLIAGGLAVIGTAVGLVLWGLSSGMAYFKSPTELLAEMPGSAQRIRLGGLVETNSVQRDGTDTVHFRVTDTVDSVPVTYTGLLPDLFREGQGVIAEGTLGSDRVFVADSVLAKHDETYMPKEVVDDLKKRGLWEDGKIKAQAEPAAAGAGT